MLGLRSLEHVQVRQSGLRRWDEGVEGWEIAQPHLIACAQSSVFRGMGSTEDRLQALKVTSGRTGIRVY